MSQAQKIETRSTRRRNQTLWLLVPLWALIIGASEYVSRRLQPSLETADHFGWTLVGGAMVVTGVLILANRPRNRVGRLVFAAGTCFALGDLLLVGSYLIFQQGNADAAGLLEALAFSAETLGIPLLIASLVFFPDEQLPSPRWRWIVPALWVSGALAILAPLANGGWGGEAAEAVRPNPLREVLSPLGEVLASGFGLAMIVTSAAAAFALILRFKRSSGVTKQQMKWLALAAMLLIIWIPMDALADRARWMRVVSDFGPVVFTAALTAIALAVLRYRLYEIDRIISRTVSYSLVVALIAGVFFAGVTALGSLLPNDSPLAVAGSTLAVAALFDPARKRIQNWVDRRFNRSRYQAEQVSDGFTSHIRDQTDLDSLASGLCSVVDATLHPVRIGIWISGKS